MADLTITNENKNRFTEISTPGVSTNTGVTSPGTMANDTSVGTEGWGSVDNAKTSDDVRAEIASLTSNAISNYLKATNFGFPIPSGATINGIKVEIEQSKTLGSTIENSVRLVKDGNIEGDNNSTGASLPGSDAYITYGSSSDLWGLSWTTAQIKASNFGVVFAVQGDPNGNVRVDHIRITVYYTTASIEATFRNESKPTRTTITTESKNNLTISNEAKS